MRVLIVEGQIKLAALIRRGLRGEAEVTDVAPTGASALRSAGAAEYDVIVLDAALPDMDGLEALRRLRAEGIWTPVLVLTARGGADERLRGLDGGADDLLEKPFSLAELGSRLRTLVRRSPDERPDLLTAGDLVLAPGVRRVHRGATELWLSAREFALLEAFMRRPGEVLDRLQLLEHAWDYGYENRSNIVDVYVRYLREKVDRPFGTAAIETVRGIGYRLRPDGGCASSGQR